MEISFQGADIVENPFGVVIGRSGQTCIDNLLVETGKPKISGNEFTYPKENAPLFLQDVTEVLEEEFALQPLLPILGAELVVINSHSRSNSTFPGVPMAINTFYNMEAIIHEPTITLTIRSGSSVLATLSRSTDLNLNQVGFLVGRRADGLLTCGDDFKIETSNDGTTYTQVFFDDFNRFVYRV